MNAHARRRPRRHVPSYALSWLFIAIWAFPIYWMINTSFKPSGEILTSVPRFLPIPFTLDHYINALLKPGLVSSLLNSALITLLTVIVASGIAFLACAAIALYKPLERRSLLVALLAFQMLPPTAVLIPLFLSFRDLGLVNSYPGVVLAYLALVLPFSVWVMRGFFQGLPKELEEAARLDGASTMRIVRSIYFPLMFPGLVTTSVFSFITAWNDFIVAYVLLQDQSKYTLPVWLFSFSTNRGTDYGGIIAASVVLSIPAVVFFMLLQRHIVTGMSGGAVKG